MDQEPAPAPSAMRRYVAVLLFVATWMAAGWALHLDVGVYLLLGVPSTVLFQRFVRQRPLLALWIRSAPPFRLGRKGVVIAAALSVIPVITILGMLAETDWAGSVSGLVACVGAVGAAYAIVNFKREHLRPLAWCLLITSALDAIQWTLFLTVGGMEFKSIEGGIAARLAILVFSFLQYVAITFVMEEVTFRMLDDHLHEGRRGLGVASAVFLSALWGLWHLPGTEDLNWQVIAVLLYVHVPYGVCLSLFWRRTGTLLIPALAHSLGDAVRDAITAAG